MNTFSMFEAISLYSIELPSCDSLKIALPLTLRVAGGHLHGAVRVLAPVAVGSGNRELDAISPAEIATAMPSHSST